MQQKDEPKVIVDQEALNALSSGQGAVETDSGGWEEDTPVMSPTVDVESDSVEITLEDETEMPLAPETQVHLPGVHEKPVGNERRVLLVGTRDQDEIRHPSAASAGGGQTPSLPPDVEPVLAGQSSLFGWPFIIALFVGVLIVALLMQKCAIGNSADQLDRIEQVAVSARQAADDAVKATAELSGTVGELAQEVKDANKVASTTEATLTKFSHALLGNPADPATPGLLSDMLDETRRVRQALVSQKRELREFHMEFTSREAQLADLNSRLDTLSQQAEETFREVRVVREVVGKSRKVNVTVGVEPTKIVVDK